MRLYLTGLILLMMVGVGVVAGQTENIGTGYKIRQLSMQKRELIYEMKNLDYRLATLTTPGNLKRWMLAHGGLSQNKSIQLAALSTPPSVIEDTPQIRLAQLFLGTARASGNVVEGN